MTFSEIEQGIKSAPALPDPIDSRDFQLEDFAGLPPLPDTFSIRDKQTPVMSQQSRGICVGAASTAICEFFNSKEQNKILNLSEEYLFKKIKEIDLLDYGSDGYGSYLRSGAKALATHGTCLETTLPYSPNETEDYWKRVVITNQMNVEALPNRMAAYASVDVSVLALRAALVTTKSPILCGFRLFESYRESESTGFVPVPQAGEKHIGGHAMAIVGYTETHFIVKNSWGSWGANGYLLWPFEAVRFMFSAWSFIDLVLSDPELEKKLIAENRKQVPEWGLPAWDKAIIKGVVTGATRFNDILHKGELMVFFDRLGML